MTSKKVLMVAKKDFVLVDTFGGEHEVKQGEQHEVNAINLGGATLYHLSVNSCESIYSKTVIECFFDEVNKSLTHKA